MSKQKQTKNCFCTQHVVNFYFSGNSMNNLFSYCGLTDARMWASEKDLCTCTFTVISKSKNVCSVYHQNFFNESYPSYLANFDILNVFFHFTQFQSDSLFQSGQLWFVYYSLLVSGLQNNETHFSATMQVFNHGTLYF